MSNPNVITTEETAKISAAAGEGSEPQPMPTADPSKAAAAESAPHAGSDTTPTTADSAGPRHRIGAVCGAPEGPSVGCPSLGMSR